MTTKRWLGVLLAMLLMASFSLAACGDDDDSGDGGSSDTTADTGNSEAIASNPDNAGTTIVVGSKNFTEQKVLGEIFAQALAAAGYKTDKQLNLGDEKTALKALEGGDIDAYPEYTGTALGSFFGVASNEIPKDPEQAFEDAKAGFAKKGLTAFEPTPFTSSNEVALTKDKADELGVEKISDLEGKSQDLTLYGSPECRQRMDCLLGLQKVYGLQFKKFVPVDIALRHEVLTRAKPTCRSSSRPIRRSSARASSCSRTTRACSRPTTRRSSSATRRRSRPVPIWRRSSPRSRRA